MIKELVDRLNRLNITQESMHWIEDLPEDIYDEYFKDTETVSYGLNPDPHRWYETAVDVVEIEEGKFIGIRYISNTYSEYMDVEDVLWSLTFFEMEPVETITYKMVSEDE